MQKKDKRLARLLIDLQEIKLERKQNEYYNKMEDICRISNLLIDYMNETQERRLEEFSYKFFQEDLLVEYVKGRLNNKDFWIEETIRQLRGLNEYSERFYFDWYENLHTADSSDIADRMEDIIREIERH